MLLAGVCVHVCADAGWCKKRDGKGSKIYQMFMYRRVEKNKIGKRFLKFNNDFCWLGNWGWQGWRICRGRIKSVTTWYGPLRKILWLRINAKCRWQIKREWSGLQTSGSSPVGDKSRISILSVCSHQKTICHVKLIASLLFYVQKKTITKTNIRHCSVKSGNDDNQQNTTLSRDKKLRSEDTYKSGECLTSETDK